MIQRPRPRQARRSTPPRCTADELVHEIQKTIKALLGIGARLPKELMLFVKNMVFLDGAIATLAPDLDIIGEIGNVSMHFATTHGERLAGELGFDPDDVPARPRRRAGRPRLRRGHRRRLTYRELQERRELIREPAPEAEARQAASCGSSSPAARSTTRAACPPTCRWPPA